MAETKPKSETRGKKEAFQKGRIALALSGGGFRATLFHLGVIRYLRDCERLTSVAHVSGVSGGAVIAAHLVQRWEDYCSDEDDRFEAAANELIRLTQSNVRGRILLGVPFRAVLNSVTWLLRTLVQIFRNVPLFGSALRGERLHDALRARSTSDSLEHYLKRFFRKPGDLRSITNGTEKRPAPDLYIHATNLTKGGASAFHAKSQRGTLREVFYHFEDRDRGGAATIECDHMPIGRAVAYSASFPGVFPPRLLRPEGLGRRTADLQLSHLLTDGGVYDNLGLRRVDPESGETTFDRLIVSDAGAPLIPDEGAHLRGGRLFLWQFKRAVSILLGRVGQLEKDLRRHPGDDDTLIGAEKTHFVELARTYEPTSEGDIDRMAQRLLALLRTDLDAFSDLEVNNLVFHGQRVAAEVLRAEGFELDHQKPCWTPRPGSVFSSWSKSNTSRIKRKLRRGQHQRLSSLFVPLDPRTWGHLVVGALALVVLWGALQPYWLQLTLKDPPKFVFQIEATAEDRLAELCKAEMHGEESDGFWRQLCSVVGARAEETVGGKAVLQLTSIEKTGAEFVYGYVQLEASAGSDQAQQAGPPSPPQDQLRLWIMEQLPNGCEAAARREVGLRPHDVLAVRLPALLERCNVSKEIVLSLLAPSESRAEPLLLLHLRRYQIPLLSRLVRNVRTFMERGNPASADSAASQLAVDDGDASVLVDDWEVEFEKQRWTSLSVFPVDPTDTCPCPSEIEKGIDLEFPHRTARGSLFPPTDSAEEMASEGKGPGNTGEPRSDRTTSRSTEKPASPTSEPDSDPSAKQSPSTRLDEGGTSPVGEDLRIELVSLTVSDCVGFKCSIEFEVWPEGRPDEREKLEAFDARYQEPHRGLAHQVAASQPAETPLLLRAVQIKKGESVAISKPVRLLPELGRRTPLLFSDEEQRLLFWATFVANTNTMPDQRTGSAPPPEAGPIN